MQVWSVNYTLRFRHNQIPEQHFYWVVLTLTYIERLISTVCYIFNYFCLGIPEKRNSGPWEDPGPRPKMAQYAKRTQDPMRTQEPKRTQNPIRNQDSKGTQVPMRTQNPIKTQCLVKKQNSRTTTYGFTNLWWRWNQIAEVLKT